MTITAVVFDLDGTLADFNIDYRTVRADARSFLIRKGLPASILSTNESIFEMLKKAEIFLKNNGKSAIVAKEIFTEVLAIAEKYELEAAKETDLLPGVLETLKTLKKMGLKMGLLTVNSEKSTNYILKRFRIAGFFDAVVPRDRVKHVKPSVEHLQTVLKILNTEPGKAIVVGDGINDMRCAHDLNGVAVGLSTGFSSPKALIAYGADYIITSLTDLPTLIEEVDKTAMKNIHI
jgi:pyrophosphatase PpaX